MRFSQHCIVALTGLLFVFSPVLVSAQALAGFGGSGTTSGSINISGVGPILLSCLQEEIGPIGIGNGSSFGSNPFSAGSNGGGQNFTTTEGGDGPNQISNPSNVSTGQSVATNNAKVEASTSEIEKSTNSIKSDEKKATQKERCEDKIARSIALQAIDKITFSTLEWINSGFDGQPFYVENPEQFFADFATKEILGFSAQFSADAELYPFGKTLAKTLLLSYQRSLQQNMINSLNLILPYGNRQQWEADFSVGGWAGYTAYIEPNNNIFGAYLESSRYIAGNLEGTRYSKATTAQELIRQGSGLLPHKLCTQTEGGGTYIPATSVQHIEVGVPEIVAINQIPTYTLSYIVGCDGEDIFDEDGDGEPDTDGLCLVEDDVDGITEVAEDFRANSMCTNWQTLSPGSAVSYQLNKTIGSSQDQNVLVDELSESTGLILDALLNQFIEKGLASFYDSSGNYNEGNNVAWAQINGFNPGEPDNTVDLIDALNGFTNTDGDFVGIISIQEQYIENVAILLALYAEAIQRTRDLDYCVPGPNPGWQQLSAEGANAYLETIPILESIPQAGWIDSVQGWLDPGGGLTSFGDGLETTVYYNNINQAYSLLIEMLTGVSIDDNDVDPQIISKYDQFLPILYDAFEDYAGLINDRFINANDFDDNVRGDAEDFFFSLDEIVDQMNVLQEQIPNTQATLDDLIDLREQYAAVEYPVILQELQSMVDEGMNGLLDNLQTFQAFTPSQVTYIGINGQPSSYANAVEALAIELGYKITPPIADPVYAEILEDFLDLLPYTATEEHLNLILNNIDDTIDNIGDPTDDESLIGLTYLCIQQINETGPYQGVPFVGYTERKEYPYPLSTDIPGLLSLPVTDTFLEDKTAGVSSGDIYIDIEPTSAVSPATDLIKFEENFINLGSSLY